jgi:hypothetical protein
MVSFIGQAGVNWGTDVAIRKPDDPAKTCMKTAPILITQEIAKVSLLPSLSARYPLPIAPKNPPIDAAVLNAICQGALVMYLPSKIYPKSFWNEGTEMTPLESCG